MYLHFNFPNGEAHLKCARKFHSCLQKHPQVLFLNTEIKFDFFKCLINFLDWVCSYIEVNRDDQLYIMGRISSLPWRQTSKSYPKHRILRMLFQSEYPQSIQYDVAGTSENFNWKYHVTSYDGQSQYSRATPLLHSLRNSLFAEQTKR